MGLVKYEHKFHFPKGHVWILFDAGESNEYGYEIDFTGEDGFGGALHGINNWSFGYETDSRDLWIAWGNYVSSRLEAIEGDQKALEELIQELDQINCSYLLYETGQDELKDGKIHMKDLDKIKSLLEESV